jgi:hypothetical protein
MAVNVLKILRSAILGNRPSGHVYGEPYVNFAENQFGVINSSGGAQDLIGVPIFSTAATYTAGQPVNRGGILYVALVNVAAGTFNPAQWSQVATAASVGASSFSGYVNRFRNGAFEISQRYPSATATTSGAGVIVHDGWYVYSTGAAVTAYMAPGRKLTNGSMRINGLAGVTDAQVFQRIESIVIGPLNGNTVTVQAQIYNSTGASFTPSLIVTAPTAADNYASTTSVLASTPLQPCPNGAWTQVAYTFANPLQATLLGLQVTFDFGTALAGASRYIEITEADIRSTPGVSIGLNNNPPVPEMRPFPVEMVFCQRYFEKSYDYANGPGTVTSASAAYNSANYLNGGAQPTYMNTIGFKVMKRATPTITMISYNGSYGYVWDGVNGVSVSPQLNGGTSYFAWGGTSYVPIPANGAWAMQGHWIAVAEV